MIRGSLATTLGVIVYIVGSSAMAQTPQIPPTFKVTLLGTGSPTPSAERLGPCTLVEAGTERLLFDAGRGCTIRLAQARVPWRELTNVFLTHLHADHTFALPDLFVMGWVYGRADPLDVRGPSGTKEMLASMIHALDLDIASRLRSGMQARLPPKYVATQIKRGVVYERGGIKVTAFEVDHSITPAFGYRIDFNGRSVVISGDTRYSETLIQNAQGVDVLVHEVVFGSPNMTTEQQLITKAHTLPDQAAQVFAATKPKLGIYSHVILFGGASDDDVMAATRKGYSGRVEMGTDLTVLEVGDDVRILRPPLATAALTVGTATTAPGQTCTAQERSAALREMQAEVLRTVPQRLDSLADAIKPGNALAGSVMSHGHVVFAHSGSVPVGNVRATEPWPQLLQYAPSSSSSPSDWLDFDGPDGPYRLVGWAYLARYEPGSAPPSRRCIAPEEWYIHDAGWHLTNGGMIGTPDATVEPPRPNLGNIGIVTWHPQYWDLHVWLGDDGTPTVSFANPGAPGGGLHMPDEVNFRLVDGQRQLAAHAAH